MHDLHDTVAVLGAGFSVPAGLPPANRISSEFLGVVENDEQRVISGSSESNEVVLPVVTS